MNIRVDLQKTIYHGMDVVFRSPVDCSQITGLIVYYKEDGITASKEFAFADAHGNNVGDIDHLFAENVVVKVILDLSTNMAFVQNADTNAYLEGRFEALVEDIAQKNSTHACTGQELHDLFTSKNLVVGDLYIIAEPFTTKEGYENGDIWKAQKVNVLYRLGNVNDKETTSQGRNAKYTFSTGGWKRILNIIRASNGEVDLGLVCNFPYRSTQILAFDMTGYVKYPTQSDGTQGDTTTTSKPILIKRYENSFGITGTQNNPQAKITKIRVGYPAPGEAPNGDKYNPINCYIDIYVDIDESKIIEGRALPDFNMNYAGFADSHNCEAITVETDATETGIYGETLTFYEVNVADMNGYMTRESINRGGAYPHYGLAFTGGGKGVDLRIVPATEAQIDAASATCYNPITPGNLEYAVKAIGDKNYALVSEFSKYFPLASKYGLYLNNGYLSVTPATTTQIDLRQSQYSVITPYNLKYAVDSVLDEHSLLNGSGTTFVWRGEYDENGSYSKGDAVSYNGSSYICTYDNTPTVPGEAGAEWDLLAEKGEQGIQGEPGADGKDYVLTDADKTEIVNSVIAALPVYDGGVA